MGRLQGLGPQLRDAGRSAWEPGQAWALPTPQQQRVRRGHPGRGPQSQRFRTRLRTPASTSRQVRARPLPGPAARGTGSGDTTPIPSLPGRRPWGERWAPGSCGWGKPGEGGARVEGGTVRRPEPSAQSGGASRSLQQRRPSQTPRSRRGQPSPETPPPQETARPPPAGGRDAAGSGATTHQSQRVLTLATRSLTPRKRVVTGVAMTPIGGKG